MKIKLEEDDCRVKISLSTAAAIMSRKEKEKERKMMKFMAGRVELLSLLKKKQQQLGVAERQKK